MSINILKGIILKSKAAILITLIAFLFSSCNRNDTRIPNIPVNIVVNTLDPQYEKLNGIGGWAYTSGGSKGIVIFKSDYNEFKAYDRHCPYQSDEACSMVNVDENNLFAVDTCCASKFQLIDGNPIEGPAKLGLRQYNTSFDGNIIQIWN